MQQKELKKTAEKQLWEEICKEFKRFFFIFQLKSLQKKLYLNIPYLRNTSPKLSSSEEEATADLFFRLPPKEEEAD